VGALRLARPGRHSAGPGCRRCPSRPKFEHQNQP
jgi:hypothetical protein